jgi:hypothetical protein
MSRLKWNFKKYQDFLKSYGFILGHIEGSHYYYNGRISGEYRVVQVIFSKKEKACQSIRTINMGIKHSGIPRKYFEEWNRDNTVHNEIIF